MVTGAAGFIASQVCSQLLDKGNKVVGVDNLNDYYDVRLKDCLQQLKKHPNCQNFYFENLDIENQEGLKVLFKNHGLFDAVLNLAARAGVRYSMENPHIYLSTNVEGTLNLWNACVKTDARNLFSHPPHPSMQGKRCLSLKTFLSMNLYHLMLHPRKQVS